MCELDALCVLCALCGERPILTRAEYNIRATVRALFAELHRAKVDYVLVGGVALLSYIEGRNTQDVNLIVAPKQLKKIDFGTHRSPTKIALVF